MRSESATEIVFQFWSYFNDRQWDEAQALLSDDFEAYWPQSQERFVGPANFIEVNRIYSGSHKIEVLNVYQQHDIWSHTDTVVSEVFIQSKMPDGKESKLFAVSIFEIEDEKIKGVTEYWADTYPAPDWRKHLTAPYDPGIESYGKA